MHRNTREMCSKRDVSSKVSASRPRAANTMKGGTQQKPQALELEAS